MNRIPAELGVGETLASMQVPSRHVDELVSPPRAGTSVPPVPASSVAQGSWSVTDKDWVLGGHSTWQLGSTDDINQGHFRTPVFLFHAHSHPSKHSATGGVCPGKQKVQAHVGEVTAQLQESWPLLPRATLALRRQTLLV